MVSIRKTKIVLDSDVIIHFSKGECFHVLLDIFPEYEYIILDIVYDELRKHPQTKLMIDRAEKWFSNKLSIHPFSPKEGSTKDYALLRKTCGVGEAACMIYCRDNNDVLGSSNLKDIQIFCDRYSITYLTTLDFLYYAYIRGKMNRETCNEFMKKVKENGSILPDYITDIAHYKCGVAI